MKEEQKDDKDQKKKHQKIFSTVGTPDYIALEVLYQKGIYSIKFFDGIYNICYMILYRL